MFQSWQLIENKVAQIIGLSIKLIIFLGVGTLPYIDNFAREHETCCGWCSTLHSITFTISPIALIHIHVSKWQTWVALFPALSRESRFFRTLSLERSMNGENAFSSSLRSSC
jgi:hypothetical protein